MNKLNVKWYNCIFQMTGMSQFVIPNKNLIVFVFAGCAYVYCFAPLSSHIYECDGPLYTPVNRIPFDL